MNRKRDLIEQIQFLNDRQVEFIRNFIENQLLPKKEPKKKIVKLKVPLVQEQIAGNMYRKTDPKIILLFETINEIIDFINKW